MIQSTSYRDLRGKEIPLQHLDDDEQQLVEELKAEAAKQPPCNSFDNYWMKRVGDFYIHRGMGRRDITKAAPWRVAQDLSGRLAIDQGQALAPDDRDELDELIRDNGAGFAPLAEKLERFVHDRTEGMLRNLRVTVCDDGIVLTGTAPSYDVKQLAMHALGEALPGAHVENRIAVA